jgi:hypothetical protein
MSRQIPDSFLRNLNVESQTNAENHIKQSINVCKIGKIITINEQKAEILLIEKSKYLGKTQAMPLLTCRLLTNNGLITSYKIDDFVIMLFSDIDYSLFHKNVLSFEIDYNSSPASLHSKSNGYILSRIESQVLNSEITGIKENNAKLAIHRENEKIIIENEDGNLKEILKDKIDKLDALFININNYHSQVTNAAFQLCLSLFQLTQNITIASAPIDNKVAFTTLISQLQTSINQQTQQNTELLTLKQELLDIKENLNNLFN